MSIEYKALPDGANSPQKTGVTARLRELALAEIMTVDIGEKWHPSIFVKDIDSQRLAVLATQLGGPGWYTVRAEEDGCRIWKKAEPTKLKRENRGRPTNG